MLSKPARVPDAAGDDTAAAVKGTSSEVVVRRAALLQLEEAIESAWIIFGRRAGGPHASDGTKTAEKPTIEEIFVAQKAVLEVLGEKGSEKRKHACELSTQRAASLTSRRGSGIFSPTSSSACCRRTRTRLAASPSGPLISCPRRR